jgi:hypothetical protein
MTINCSIAIIRLQKDFLIINLPTLLLNNSKNTKMSRIKDYVVITSTKGIDAFETLIKQNIERGWQPLGGVAIIYPPVENEDGTIKKPEAYAQAMVLYE